MRQSTLHHARRNRGDMLFFVQTVSGITLGGEESQVKTTGATTQGPLLQDMYARVCDWHVEQQLPVLPDCGSPIVMLGAGDRTLKHDIKDEHEMPQK